jgi:ADP-heptose:LPS heptosyltransferase
MKQFFLKLFDATLGWFLCWTIGIIRHILRRDTSLPPSLTSPPPARLLLIRPGGMGDMILLLPTLNALRRRFPNIKLDLVCEKRNSDILKLANAPDHILLYDSHPFQLLAHLCRHRYDAVIDTEQFHYFSSLMAILARSPVRVGFKISPGRNLLYTHLVNYDMEGYEADQFISLLRPFGISDSAVVEGTLRSGPSLPDVIDQLLSSTKGARLVTVQAGSTSRYKQWSTRNFAEVLHRLGEDQRLVFAIVGNKSDRRHSKALAKRAGLGSRVMMVAGHLSMAQTASVLARSSLHIGGDSGLMHAAVALVVPTVTLFGPSDSRKWGARSKLHAIVKREPPCAPCFIFGYHKLCHTIACMSTITTDDVATACHKSLG